MRPKIAAGLGVGAMVLLLAGSFLGFRTEPVAEPEPLIVDADALRMEPAPVPRTRAPAVQRAPRRAADRPAVQAATRPEAAELPPDRGSRALSRMDRIEADLDDRLDGWVEAGDLTDEEAEQIQEITAITLDDARDVVQQAQDGEIRWIGAWARGMRLRVRHASAVVNLVGRDRAVDLAQKWKADQPR